MASTTTSRASITPIQGCLFTAFCYFFISFWKIKKLDASKNKKLEASFHKLLSFSFLGSSNFWISQKLIHKNDEKLKQTLPQYVNVAPFVTISEHFMLFSSIMDFRKVHKYPHEK
jgi:hypothetical protein